jgi:predicted NBD/HSP70 family sugar kinase
MSARERPELFLHEREIFISDSRSFRQVGGENVELSEMTVEGPDKPKRPGGALREANRLRVVDELRRHATLSRADLARLTGLSPTTMTALVAELRASGVVVEQAVRDGAAEPAGRGRPPVLLRLDPAAGGALGIDFGHRHLRVVLADLSRTVLAERSMAMDVDAAAKGSLDAAAAMVDEVLAEAGMDRRRVIGAGVGLPGPIDVRTGAVGSSVILPDWVGLLPAQELERRLDVSVTVDNDANLGALGEVAFGSARGLSDILYVKVSSGIGAGLVLGGHLYHGATGLAGELGHVHVRDQRAVCRCGNRGCLETVAATGAVLAALRPAHRADLTVRDAVGLVRSGDLGAQRVIADAGRAIGRVLADHCNLLNPAAIVVGGELSAAGHPLLDGIRESVDRYAQPAVAASVAILAGQLGERAEVLGALATIIGDTERVGSAGLIDL